MKKFSRCVLVMIVLVLLTVFLPPTKAIGISNNIPTGDEINAYYYKEIAKKCLSDAEDTKADYDSMWSASLDELYKVLGDYLQLRFMYEGKVAINDSYKEKEILGEVSNGALTCDAINDIIPNYLKSKNAYSNLENYICGTDGTNGLLKIRIGHYNGGIFGHNWGSVSGWDDVLVDKDGYVNSLSSCKNVISHIQISVDQKKLPVNGTRAVIVYEVNKNYQLVSPAEEGAHEDIRDNIRFSTLMNTCTSRTFNTKEEADVYDYNYGGVKRVYYAGQYKYIVPTRGQRYFLFDTSGQTCDELVDAFEANVPEAEDIFSDNIEQCMSTMRNNVQKVTDLRLHTQKITDEMTNLISAGDALAGVGLSDGDAKNRIENLINMQEERNSEYERLYRWSSKIGEYKTKISDSLLGGSESTGIVKSINDIMSETRKTEDAIIEYYKKKNGYSGYSYPNQAEDEEFRNGLLAQYKSNRDSFKQKYTTPLSSYSYLSFNEASRNVTTYGAPTNTPMSYYGYTTTPVYNITENSDGTLHFECMWEGDIWKGIEGNVNSITGTEVSFSTYNPSSSDTGPVDNPIIDSDSGTLVGESDPCFAGAGSLGWILCPISSALANSLDHIYENIVEDFLVVDARMFTNNNGAHDAWGTFVNIANILMVIFLLVIVFSQLTGVGIDNYGIKKALPKIIIGAILINLSYIICQTLVDVSNIIGDSVNNLLSSIGDGITAIPSNFSGSDVGHSGLFQTLIGSTMLTAGAAAGLSIYAGVMEAGGFFGVFVPILIAALGALISVLFFFIILGIRQVAVILLVVISPLAFVCYMLPNTKSLFDKWKKLFKTMLLVYPIAGLTVGGGYLATKILMSTGAGGSANAFMMLTYIVTMVYPFFLVPTMISKSMGALGDITSKLSNFGRGLRQRTANGLNRGIQGSARYQAARQEAAERQKYRVGRAANRLARRNEDRLNERALERAARGRKLSASDQARLDRYRRTQADWTTDREATGDRVSDGSFYAGYANQRRSESSNKNKDTRQWANSRYVSARDSKANTDRQMAYEDAIQWNDGRIAQAALDDNRNKLNERMARARAGVVVKDQDVLRRQAESQRNLDLANNNLDVTSQITKEYADSLAKGRFDTAQQKMYAESFKNLTRAQSEIKLNNLLKGDQSESEFKNDTNYLEALISDLRGKGGSVEVAKALMNNMSAPSVNSTKEEMDYYKTLTSIAATMSDQPIVKQWGKYAQDVMQHMVIENGATQSATPVSLATWIQNGDGRMLLNTDGSTFELDSQKQSLKKYLTENPKITAGMDKDQLDLLSTIYRNNPSVLADGRSAIYASLGASTAEERKKSEGVIDTYVKNKIPDARADDLANIPISDFVKMEPEIFARLVYGDVNGNMNNVVANSKMEQMLRKKAEQIGQAGGNVLASLSPEIRDALENRFGPLGSLSSGTPTAQPQGGNNNP